MPLRTRLPLPVRPRLPLWGRRDGRRVRAKLGSVYSKEGVSEVTAMDCLHRLEGERAKHLRFARSRLASDADVRLHRARRSMRARIEQRCVFRTVSEALACPCDGC